MSSKFKIGDRVRLTGKRWGCGMFPDLQTGSIVVVDHFNPTSGLAAFTIGDGAQPSIFEKGRLGLDWGAELVEDEYANVTRITVVTEDEGRVFEAYNAYDNGVELSLQDDGRTLKIFPRGPYA